MEKRYLIDSNTIIESIDAVPNISIITRIEVLGFNAPDEHYQTLTNFMNDAVILNIDTATADKSIYVRKTCKIKLPDAIIAATAIVNKLILITRNISDFNDIEGLQVINPHDL